MVRTGAAGVAAAILVMGLAAAPAPAQYGGPPGPGGPDGEPAQGRPLDRPGRGGAPTPEIAKRIDAVRVLREIVTLGIGKSDIAAALPILRRLLQAEAVAQAGSIAALEQQKKALLAATSPDRMPPLPTDALRAQAAALRAQQTKLWAEMSTAIGAVKASELRRLLGSARTGPPQPRGGPGPGGPGGFGGFGGPGGRGGPGMRDGSGPGPQGYGGFGGIGRSPGLNPATDLMDQPHISLAELTSLLEQRFAALK